MVQENSESGVTMPEPMGTFRIDMEIENPVQPGPRVAVPGVLVDTGSELSWVPPGVLEPRAIERRKLRRFRQASGTILERWAGQASIYAAGTWTSDEVVFGEPADLVLLGARSLEGLNLRVDPVTMTLFNAGPAPAAAGPR